VRNIDSVDAAVEAVAAEAGQERGRTSGGGACGDEAARRPLVTPRLHTIRCRPGDRR
jgi:hypothetical protein